MNKGVIYSVLAALAFSFQNVIVKDLSVSMGTGEIAFFRGTVSAVIIVALMKLQGIHLPMKTAPHWHYEAFWVVSAWFVCFYGLRGVPLGDASILSQLSAFFCHALCSDFSERSHS